MVWTWIVHGRLPEPRIRGRPSGPAERAGLLAACLARAGRLSRLVLGGPPASCWAGSRLPSASCWAALPLPGPTAGWVLPRLLGRRLGSRARRLLARARLPPAEAPGPAPPAAEAAPPERGPCWAALPLAGPTAGWLLPRLLGRRLGSRTRRLLARAELLPAEAGCWVTAATPAGSATGEPCSAAAGAGPASGAAEGGGPRGHLPPRRISILRMERARAIWRGEHQWRRLLGTAWEPQCRQSYKRKRTKCALNQDVGKAELRHVSRKPNQGALEEGLEEVGEEEGPSRLMPELLHHLGKEVRGKFETKVWYACAKRRPPDPPISMLMGRTVAGVVQSIRALAGTPVPANIEIGGGGVCLLRNFTPAPAHKPLSSTGAIVRASTVLHPFLSPPPVRFSLSFDATWAFRSLHQFTTRYPLLLNRTSSTGVIFQNRGGPFLHPRTRRSFLLQQR